MTAPRFRIGNDLTVLWAINNRDGSPFNLEGKVVRLFVSNERGREEVKFSLDTLPDGSTNNVLRWDFKGKEQRVLGLHTLTVEIQTAPEYKEIKRDYCNAFSLVASSCCEDTSEGEANILDGGELLLSSRLDVFRFGIPKISIGANGNWFIDGVDTGHPSFAGEGLVNTIYNIEDFGGAFSSDSRTDTFNAHAVNSLFLKIQELTSETPITLDILESWEDYNPEAQQVLSAILGIQLKGNYDALAKRVDALEKEVEDYQCDSFWQEDDEGNIWTDRNVYSTGQVSSGGVGEEGSTGGGGASGFSILEDWNSFDDSLSQALGAVLGIELHNRLTQIENGSVTPDLSQYATISFVRSQISNLINGAPEAYDTLKEIADVLNGNVNNINDLLIAISTKASKEELNEVDKRISEEVSDIKEKQVDIINRLIEIESYWTIEDGNLKTEYNVYSTKQVSSGGVGEEGSTGGSGSGFVLLEKWEDYDDTIAQALGASLGLHLHNRLTQIENGSIAPDLSSYATQAYVIARINALWDGVPEAYNSLSKIADALQGNQTSLTDIASEIQSIWESLGLIDGEIKRLKSEDTVIKNRLSKLESFWSEDDNGNLWTDRNVYSYGQVSSGGVGTEGDGSGSGSGGMGSLAGASDTNINNQQDGDIIVWSESTDKWVNRRGMVHHVQTTPAKVWYINHGMGKFPNVKIVDSNKQLCMADIYYVDKNNVRIEFGAAESGSAYLD